MPRTPETTRRHLLEAAAREFLRHGFEATGLNTLLQTTGLTKGALFHHFAGKEALALAVVSELLEPAIRQRWLEPLAAASTPVDTLRDILQTAADESSRPRGAELPGPLSPLTGWLAVHQAHAPELRQRVLALHDLWRDGIADALRRGRDAGTVHRAIHPTHEADFLLAWFHGASAVIDARGAERAAGLFQAALAYLETLRPAAG